MPVEEYKPVLKGICEYELDCISELCKIQQTALELRFLSLYNVDSYINSECSVSDDHYSQHEYYQIIILIDAKAECPPTINHE
jgi:hypothetical protein